MPTTDPPLTPDPTTAPTISAPSNPPRIEILGLPVDAVTADQSLAWIAAAVDDHRAALLHHTPIPATRHLITLNPEMVMAARRDPNLRAIIRAADLVVPDGIGIVWAARLLGTPLPARVTGIDLLEAVATDPTIPDQHVFLLGAAPGIAAEAARRLAARQHSTTRIYVLSGSPKPSDLDTVLSVIFTTSPDVLFVAFGGPAQEQWIATHRDLLPAAVAIGVGGAFDFIAGTVPRAPDWLRRLGMEWLYRLYRQPWRWRRMMALPHFGALVLWQSIIVHLSRVPARREKSK